MHRNGLLVTLAIGGVVGLVFGLYPELDLKLAALFYEPTRIGFSHRLDPPLIVVREGAMWVVRLIAIAVGAALIWKLIWPTRRLLIPGRAVVFLLATLALAPGLMANVGLKENWGRSRPIDVPEFNGSERFVAWWDPRGICPQNCSFVSGDVAAAFWTIAPAALTPPPWRAVAYGGALLLGGMVAVLRMAFGGHFFTDVVFAGVFTMLVIWLVYALMYRWRATRLSDAKVEAWLERIAMPGHRLVRRVLAGRGAPEPETVAKRQAPASGG